MTEEQSTSERERLDALREEVTYELLTATDTFDDQSILQPLLDWLADVQNQLEEHQEILRSDNEDDPIDEEDVEDLVIWAESFSSLLNDAGGAVEDSCDVDMHEEAYSVLVHLMSHVLKPVLKAGWALHSASIRSD